MIIGHKKIISYLERMTEEGTTSRNYLFLGPSQVGKKTVALKFIQALFCKTSKKIDREECDCSECHAEALGVHADVIILDTSSDVREIPVEEIKNLKEKLSLSSFHTIRVVLINNAETLTQASSNALLKLMEDQSTGTFFILVAGRDTLPRTVVSRLEVVHFARVASDEMKQGLQSLLLHENATRDTDTALYLSFGRPGLLTEFMKDATILTQYKRLFADFASFGNDSLIAKINYFEKYKDEDQIRLLLAAWARFTSDLIKERQGIKNVFPKEFEALVHHSDTADSYLEKFFRTLLSLKEAHGKFNLNRRLALDQLAII